MPVVEYVSNLDLSVLSHRLYSIEAFQTMQYIYMIKTQSLCVYLSGWIKEMEEYNSNYNRDRG